WQPDGTGDPDAERRDPEVGPSDDDLRGPMDTDLTLLILVTGTCLAVLGWAGRKRFPLRIGVGNFCRRKTQVAIVVAGLLIGTSVPSSGRTGPRGRGPASAHLRRSSMRSSPKPSRRRRAMNSP